MRGPFIPVASMDRQSLKAKAYCYKPETREQFGSLTNANPSVCAIKKASCHVLKVADEVPFEDEKNHWFYYRAARRSGFDRDTNVIL